MSGPATSAGARLTIASTPAGSNAGQHAAKRGTGMNRKDPRAGRGDDKPMIGRSATGSRRRATRSVSAATWARRCGGRSATAGPSAGLRPQGRRRCAHGSAGGRPARGIARARVVLSGGLARCQREAARAPVTALPAPVRGRLPAVKDGQRLVLAARVDVADGGAVTQLARSRPRAQPVRTRPGTRWPGAGRGRAGQEQAGACAGSPGRSLAGRWAPPCWRLLSWSGAG